MLDYHTWKTGPARDLLLQAFRFDTAARASWSEYRIGFLAHLEATNQDPQEAVARTHLSTSETIVVAAALYAADCGDLADRMLAPGFFYRLASASDAMLVAALTPMLQRCSRQLPDEWRGHLPGLSE